MVVSIEDLSCVAFGPIRPNEGGELGVTQIREFVENKKLTTNFFEIEYCYEK